MWNCEKIHRKFPFCILSSIHPSTHCVCIQFGWFFHSIRSAMHISYYHLFQCMCLNVSVLNVCLSFGMWVDVRFFTYQIHSLLLIVFLKHFFRFHSLFLSNFYSNGYHCHDRKKRYSIHKYFTLNFVVNSENWWCKSKEFKNAIDIKWSLKRVRVRDCIIVAPLMSCQYLHFFIFVEK